MTMELKCNTSLTKFSLLSLEPGNSGYIIEVPDHSLLAPLGIRPGKEIAVEARQPFNGPIVAEVEGRQIAIERDLAENIKLCSGE